MPTKSFAESYHIQETPYENQRVIVYRVERKDDGQTFLVKLLKNKLPSRNELAQFKKEYELTRQTKNSGILRSLELVFFDENLALVQEDFSGGLLRDAMGAGILPLTLVLELAITLSRHLSELHKEGVVHRNLSPESLLVDTSRCEVKLTNWEFASILNREYGDIINSEVFGRDLKYIAPEQTGRMNCPIDYRSDLYALGVLLYEMVSGKCPFNDDDPLSLVYAHLARQPEPPTCWQPDLPAPLENLILKLLKKNPEERYQSARALTADLKQCLAGLKSPEGITAFPLGRHDLRGGLHAGIRLYGRQEETAMILATFAEACAGRRQLLLITGYSGVGKTSLVREVYRPITKSRGYFAKGKYDQLQKNVPFSAMVTVFRGLLQQMLSESDARLVYWRNLLQTALGGNGRLLTDILPELETIIGPQPPVEVIPASESKHRFNRTFRKFIHVFCHKDHPLVLFLDDLQWIDTASLDLLRQLMEDEEAHYLLVIGAYRDNEVDQTHPLTIVLQDLKSRQIAVNQIPLQPLTREDVNQLLADTLEESLGDIMPLADLLMKKTRGNPFFLRQLLRRLYSDELLYFDETRQHWRWDLAQINAENITENVVEMMVDNLRKLSKPTQQVLSLAACIGNSFSLKTLGVVSEQTPEATFGQLLPALEEDLIANASGFDLTDGILEQAHLVIFNFRFQHDRIQQAAYSLIEEKQLPELHLNIGRKLLADAGTVENAEDIFAIADHLNSGRTMIRAEDELIELARINLNAAKEAREATAYQAALSYMRAGMERLPDDTWQSHYALALEIHRERANVESLNGHFEESERLIRHTAEKVKTPVEKAELLHMLIVQYTLAARYPEAIELARETLALLDIEVPKENFEVVRDGQMALVDEKLAGRDIRSLQELPLMTAPDKIVAMRILTAMGPPCYRSHQRLWAVIVSMEMNLLLEYGNVPAAAYTYTSYGGLLGFVRGQYENCKNFAEIAIVVAEKYQSSSDLSVAHLMIGASLDHWFRHLKFAEESYRQAYQVGLDSGNLQYSVYAFGHQMYCRFFRGMPIEDQLHDLPNFLSFSRSRKNQWGIDLKLGILMVVRNLAAKTGDIFDFNSGEETEQVYLSRCEQQQNIQVLCIYRLLKAYALYLHEAYPQALENLLEAEKHLQSVSTQGLLPSAEFYFIQALITAASYQGLNEAEQKSALRKLRQNREKIIAWADLCPENFYHKALLIDAELAVLEQRYLEADQLYEQAAEEAGRQGFIQHQALAWERGARLWVALDKPAFAEVYAEKSINVYRLWGAHRKTGMLTKLLENQTKAETLAAEPGRVSETSELDLIAVTKASQAISGQVRYPDLLTTLMEIVLETSGAQKVVLLVPNEGSLEVSAKIDQTHHVQLFNAPEKLESAKEFSQTMVNYVTRTQEQVVLGDDNRGLFYETCSYLQKVQPSSAACLPLLNRGTLLGVLCLENTLTPHAFGPSHLLVLQLLAAQAAISFENAGLYSQLEERVASRTAELNRVNSKLQASEKKYRTLFEAMNQPMALHEIICDASGRPIDYRFLDVNPAFEELLAKDYDEIVGRTALELLPDLQPFWIEIYGKVASGEGSIHFQDYSLPLDRHFDIVAYSPIEGQFAVVANDITEFKQTQEEHQKVEAQLHQAQKIESVGRLAGGVAHDYNNMLGVIIGYAELAQMKLDSADSVQQDLNEILSAAKRSRDITRQLLAFARKQIIAPEVLDLNHKIETTLKMLRNLLGENIDLAWLPKANLWPVEIDPTQLDQILANLCVNARDAIVDVGKMTIETANVSLDQDYCDDHPGFMPGDFLMLAVSDDGCGMDKETLGHIFEPFFSTKEFGEGTGLGLATVYGIVKQSKGFINVYSEPGEGTTFKIYLPRYFGTAEMESETLEAKVINGKGETVLVVEDELAILKLTTTILKDFGYEVLTANSPTEALALAESRPGEIEMLITDVVMPGMNGKELAERILLINPQLKCLYMSGYTANVIAHHGILDQGIHFIQKPFSRGELSTFLRDIFDLEASPERK